MSDHQIFKIGEFQAQVEKRLKLWKEQNFSRKLWSRDPTLWFPEAQPEITDRLGWLSLPETMPDKLEELVFLAEQVKDEGMRHVVLLGMGGSSLAPDVFQKTFGNADGYPRLIVLDSTHPSAVLAVEEKLDLQRALFLVSSKSGTTLETLSLFRYFWSRVSQAVDQPGRHFVAITDSGTSLQNLALERGFRRVFEADPDVGGRYSALTCFGMVPAALIGMDVRRLLDRARIAAENCAFSVSEEMAPGFILGAALGEIAKKRDKLTFFASSSISSFPGWLEQLIAESTGKDGKGIVPVAGESSVPSEDYGQDRLFVFLTLKGEDDREVEERIKALSQAGHPVIQIGLKDKYDLGREIFSWEVAVASASSVLGIHPFNQPDVQLAKDFTRKAMEKRGKEAERKAVDAWSIDDSEALAQALKEWLSQARLGDYISLQAYLAPTPKMTEALQGIRLELLYRTRLATTLGYGPRFLHSTGQLHKGGQNAGLFLQLIDEPDTGLSVPETGYDFRSLIRAQAEGDGGALRERGRRVLRVDLKTDVAKGLEALHALIQQE